MLIFHRIRDIVIPNNYSMSRSWLRDSHVFIIIYIARNMQSEFKYSTYICMNMLCVYNRNRKMEMYTACSNVDSLLTLCIAHWQSHKSMWYDCYSTFVDVIFILKYVCNLWFVELAIVCETSMIIINMIICDNSLHNCVTIDIMRSGDVASAIVRVDSVVGPRKQFQLLFLLYYLIK